MTLEERVAELERRLGEESRLRGPADVDSSMRAMRHLVQAIAIVQSQHTSTQEQHTELLLRLVSGVRDIATMLDELVRRDRDDEAQR